VLCNCGRVTAHQQLAAARKAKGLTLKRLKKKAGLRCSVVSLSRKLSGQQAMTNAEIAAIARALGEPVTVVETVVTLGAAA
jgi:transcriptional regulator with XRE-family HTH domain